MRHVGHDGWRAADGRWRPGKPPTGWEQAPDGRWLAPLMPPGRASAETPVLTPEAMVTLVSPLRAPRRPPTGAHPAILDVDDGPVDAASLFDWDTLRGPSSGAGPRPTDGRPPVRANGDAGGAREAARAKPTTPTAPPAWADPVGPAFGQAAQVPAARAPIFIGPDGPQGGPLPATPVAPVGGGAAAGRVPAGTWGQPSGLEPARGGAAVPGPASAARRGPGSGPQDGRGAPPASDRSGVTVEGGPAGDPSRTADDVTRVAAPAAGTAAPAGPAARDAAGAGAAGPGAPAGVGEPAEAPAAAGGGTAVTDVFADPDGWDARQGSGWGDRTGALVVGPELGGTYPAAPPPPGADDYADDDDRPGGAGLDPGANPRVLAGVAAVVLLVAAVVGLLTLGGGDEPDTATPGPTTSTTEATTTTLPTTTTTAPTTTAPPTTAPTTAAPTTAAPTTAAPTTAAPTTAAPTTAAPTTAAPTTAAPTTAAPTTAAPTTAAPTTAAPTTEQDRYRDRGRDDEPHYDNCFDMVMAGAAPINEGEPGYDVSLDWDRDGQACEMPFY